MTTCASPDQTARIGRFAAYDSAQSSNPTPPPPAGGPPPLGRGGFGGPNRVRESGASRLADVVIGHYEAPICRGEHRSSAAGGTEKKPPVQIRTGCGIRICIGGMMNWYFRRRAGIGCDIRALCDGPLFDAKPVPWESYFVTLRVQPLRGWCGVFCTFSLLYRMGILMVRSVTGQAEQAWNQPSSLSIMRRPSP